MFDRRVWCASALLSIAACSFPAFRTPDGEGGALAAGCSNKVRDGDETGVDCGPGCGACPVCADGLRNGDETGVDCGGRCAACPSCDDHLQNGAESDVDCGGTCVKRCEPKQRCREAADCTTLVCNVVCQAAECNDHVHNGLETSTDCGGGSCPQCDNGSACGAGSDCTSNRCQNQICVSAGCTDGIANGKESDKDCGGTECAPCMVDGKCTVARDCDSGVCTSKNACAAATCSDLVRNQGESSVDCGGAGCAPCENGKTCLVPSDCETNLCQSGTCVPEFPAGQPLSRSQWVLSTSESATATGMTDPFDGNPATCWVSGASQYSGMFVDVDLGKPEIFFKALLKVTETPHDQEFPATMEVLVSNDHTFGDPVASVMGNQWTWVDFQSAQVGRYVRFRLGAPGQHMWSIGELILYN
jgi:F5/8 type C domain